MPATPGLSDFGFAAGFAGAASAILKSSLPHAGIETLGAGYALVVGFSFYWFLVPRRAEHVPPKAPINPDDHYCVYEKGTKLLDDGILVDFYHITLVQLILQLLLTDYFYIITLSTFSSNYSLLFRSILFYHRCHLRTSDPGCQEGADVGRRESPAYLP